MRMGRSFGWTVLLLSVCTLVSYAQECEVSVDGVCQDQDVSADPCQDQDDRCDEWASRDECAANPRYMLNSCQYSCNVCRRGAVDIPPEDDRLQDYGLPQVIDAERAAQVVQKIQETRQYMSNLRMYRPLVEQCRNKHENCVFWSVMGECATNKKYMQQNCAPACQMCDMLQIDARCPLDPDAVDAWYPGDLNKMFERILQDYPQYNVTVLSRPGGSTGVYDGPWVITLDDFVSQQEADRLIQLGANRGYIRSTDVGKMKADGSYEGKVNDGRTSTNAWCIHECMTDPHTQAVLQRIENLTHIPDINSENLQLLRYEPGQYYNSHHDYIPHHVKRQQGVRILTVYLYLNEVEEGGGTNFPLLDNMTVTPKRGRVLIWPSVLDEDPNKKDQRTDHQALPVIKGIKYGANAWLHQRDFKTPNQKGCQ